MTMLNRRVTFGLILALGVTACERPAEEARDVPGATAPPAALSVYAVNYPLAWMARRIGGDDVAVSLPLPPDTDPAHWQPDPETVLEYQRADLVLLNGAGYAGWIRFAALSPARLVDTTRGIEDRFVPAGEVTHSHGPTGQHDHADAASHTWLDPGLAAAQARAVAEALTRRLPERASEFQQRLASLEAELDRLDAQLAAAFQTWPSGGVLYSHPVYQYLDARYELAGRSVTWEPHEDPGEAEWRRLEKATTERPASVMLWEAEPLPATAARLRGLGIAPVVFATGAVPPPAGDYLDLMNGNVERLNQRESFGAAPRP